MPTLEAELRRKLERVVIQARDAAEVGARAALEALAVHHHEPYPHMNPAMRELHNHLRARAWQLGDGRRSKPDKSAADHDIDRLVGECAYAHWHRMLFARFLAENNLLIEPQEQMAISLAEAEELAKEEGLDVWAFASRCAQDMLPQIFRPDDPLLQVTFATEHRIKLEGLLASLPQAVFTASDALGWVYQFWQSKKKDEVNRSEAKIGANEISAVTQLFTEPYMVEFLLHNTLGAWWAGKQLSAKDAANATTEEELRRKVGLPGVPWDYLRFVRLPSSSTGEGSAEGEADSQDGPWRPAAGTFEGWPKAARDIKVLDPCCGSGHFLVGALRHLVPIRMVEEGFSAREAVDAVLHDNLHGLEIDERCCQIAAFALALAAWTYPDAAGYRPLPELHIACTGLGPNCSREEWVSVARGDGVLKDDLDRLYDLFKDAPTLGSLIDPAEVFAYTKGSPDELALGNRMDALRPYLHEALEAEMMAEGERKERAIAAAGMAKAAELLGQGYTLVVTNVPYLGRGKQDDTLRTYLDRNFKEGKADLATAFVLRCLGLCNVEEASRRFGKTRQDAASTFGTIALVTPQNWLFLTSYTKLREILLKRQEWNLVARLGPGAFETISGHVVNVALLALSARMPEQSHVMSGVDASGIKQPIEKAALLRGDKGEAASRRFGKARQDAGATFSIVLLPQAAQVRNPDMRILFNHDVRVGVLADYATSYLGLGTGDFLKYGRTFWEFPEQPPGWTRYQGPVDSTVEWGGAEHFLAWDFHVNRVRGMTDADRERIHNQDQSGQQAWQRCGVSISLMGELRASLFSGERYDKATAVLVPNSPNLLSAIWALCMDPEYNCFVREVDRNVMCSNGALVKVPFDLPYWQKVAAEKYPNGLPEPESDDPTQWLFHGRPEESAAPLQVSVARLLGYRWPAELDDKMRLSTRARELVRWCDELLQYADDDGIVCIPSVRGEEPAVDRLLALLGACGIKPEKARKLAGGADLDDWLRNGFFEEHCKLFHNRPFVWHIWDGRKRDGFHALINYHKLCEADGKGRKLLESLTYSYLGEWIARQTDGMKRGEGGGAEDRMAAALELQKRLEAILAGEPPFDIFVRWKPLAEQPIGWEPDMNDGVRLNIRPFLASDLPGGKKGAGILRAKPNIKWGKDRGKEPNRPKAEYPWFWNWDEKSQDFLGTGKEPDGNRWNDCHYTNRCKQAAREIARRSAGKGKP